MIAVQAASNHPRYLELLTPTSTPNSLYSTSNKDAIPSSSHRPIYIPENAFGLRVYLDILARSSSSSLSASFSASLSRSLSLVLALPTTVGLTSPSSIGS